MLGTGSVPPPPAEAWPARPGASKLRAGFKGKGGRPTKEKMNIEPKKTAVAMPKPAI
jgi:hypothetical protein